MYICEASKILATSARTTPTKTSPNFHTMATFYKAISTRATSKCNARLKDTRVYVCVCVGECPVTDAKYSGGAACGGSEKKTIYNMYTIWVALEEREQQQQQQP